MGKFIYGLILVVALFAGLAYFQMYQHADRVNTRIEREALGLFDVRRGIGSVEKAVHKIAKEEGVELVPNKLSCKIVASTRARTASMVGIAQPKSGTETVVVESTFKIRRFFFSHTYTKLARKDLYGTNDRPPSQRTTGHGLRPGVNLSSPSRDINSHRKTINRAAGGRNP